MNPSARSRAALAATALGVALALATATAAFAQYGTTSTTAATTTTTTSTTTTTTSVGASPGPTNPTGSGNSEKVNVSSTTVTPGSSVAVSFGSQPNTSGGPGPCAAGASISLELVLIQDGSSPTTLGSATADSTGGLGPVTVTIPSSAPQGTYVIYAQCTGANGETEIITSPVVLVSSTGTHAAYAATNFVVSPSAGTPAQQLAIDRAVRAQVAANAAGSSGAPNGGLNLSFPRLNSAGVHSTSNALTYGLIAVVVVLVAAGLLVLRRRRAVPTA